MKISRKIAGLYPEKFLTKPTLFEIVDIRAAEKEGKNGKYLQYTLELLGNSGEYIGDFTVNFLFAVDLNELIKAYGEDTDAWRGKLITVTGREDGKYYRWVIVPFMEMHG